MSESVEELDFIVWVQCPYTSSYWGYIYSGTKFIILVD